MAELFSFLADEATSLVLDAGKKLLVEGLGIQPVFLGEEGGGIPWLGQPVPAEQVFGSMDLPAGCSFNSSGALLVDLDAVAAGSGLESGLLNHWIWGDPPGDVPADHSHPFPRQGPLLNVRVEAEVRVPPALTQASAPVGASVIVGIGWPENGPVARGYLGTGFMYHPTDDLSTVHSLVQSAGGHSLTQQLDLGAHAGQKAALVAQFGHDRPTFAPRLVGEHWSIQSDQSSGFYSGQVTEDLLPAELQAWLDDGAVQIPRPFIHLNAPSAWEPGQVIEIRSFGAR